MSKVLLLVSARAYIVIASLIGISKDYSKVQVLYIGIHQYYAKVTINQNKKQVEIRLTSTKNPSKNLVFVLLIIFLRGCCSIHHLHPCSMYTQRKIGWGSSQIPPVSSLSSLFISYFDHCMIGVLQMDIKNWDWSC